jgi:peptidoglycan-N-acetylglucosamine deacetylase
MSQVALTFDMEHPSRSDQAADAPQRLLDTLRARGARATFFVQGRWARSHPDVAAKVVTDGHLVGNHSHFHAPLTSLTDEGVRADIAASGEALLQVMGVDPRPWFRCPFGAGHDDERVLGLISDAGYHNVHWNVDPADWEPGRTSDEIVDAVVAGVTGVGEGEAAVVLLHTWPRATPDAVGALIDRFGEEGRQLVGLDELGPDSLGSATASLLSAPASTHRSRG